MPESVEAQVESLLAKMTLREKVGQMHQATNSGSLDPDQIRQGLVGSVIGATSAYAGNDKQERMVAAHLNAIQKIAVEESRLGIPILVARDVIHGHRAVCPIPLGQAASWSPELVEKGAEVAAREARADGIHWTFTPMLDIARDPRWGRVAEGFGEDPFLAACLAKAAVRGYQGDDLRDPERILACAKHYLGYGAAEGGRDYNTAEISESTLRNIYMPSFRAAVDAGVATVMAAFNEIGGVPVTSSRHLLTDVLKTEWGMDGVVVSDWRAVGELVEHGVAADLKDAAYLGIHAGVDVDMQSEAFMRYAEELVTEGRLPVEEIDEAVRRILRLKFRLGLFERPYTDESLAAEVHLRPDHLQAAQELATKAVVLLKNDPPRGNGRQPWETWSGNASVVGKGPLLPLTKAGQTYAVVGPMADVTDALYGTWTLDALAEDAATLRAEIAAKVGTSADPHGLQLLDEGIANSRWSDVVIAVLGESPVRSGEDNALTSIELPAGQIEFLESLRKIGKPIVAVVVAGRPLILTRVMELADAVVWSFHPGIRGGAAIADVLFGDANPSGKLPITFPRETGQVPIYYNHKRTGRPLPKDDNRTRYIDTSDEPLLPFGYGLSYTKFAYSDLVVQTVGDGQFSVSATVENVGSVAGEEIVQLYIRDDVSTYTRPVKELKGFTRVALPAGAAETVNFTLGPNELGYYVPGAGWQVEPGTFQVWVGPHSQAGLQSSLTVG